MQTVPSKKQETGRAIALLNLYSIHQLQAARVYWKGTGKKMRLKCSLPLYKGIWQLAFTTPRQEGKTKQNQSLFQQQYHSALLSK